MHLKQVACHKPHPASARRCILAHAVARRIVPRPVDHRLASLHAQHLTRLGRQRQGEVAKPAKPVDHPIAALRAEQAQRLHDQHPVDLRINLREIGGLERHANAKLRQFISQLRPALIEQSHRVRAPGLQPPLDMPAPSRKIAAIAARERTQQRQVAFGQWLQMAQHQGDHGGAVGVAYRQFNLRTGLARLHSHHQFAQRQQQRADRFGQHRALLHVGHKAALALVKTHQHHALLAHKTYRQPGPVAVSPGRPVDGAQDRLRLELAQMPQAVFKHALLDRDLRASVQVLQLAASTRAFVQSEVRALRPHPLRGLAMDRDHRRLLEAGLAPVDIGTDDLEGQRTFNEHDLAVTAVRDALRVDVERLHPQSAIGQIDSRRPGQR